VRRTLFIWVVVPILIGIVSYEIASNSYARRWVTRAIGGPVLECPQVIDLGEQETGQDAIARLTVANRGGKDLLIDQVRSDCSCSGLERDDGGEVSAVQELRLSPGEESQLRVRVSVRGNYGTSLRTAISFHTNDPSNPDQRIEVFIPKVVGGMLTVPRFVSLGSILQGSTPHQLIEVRDESPAPRVVDHVSSSDPESISVRWLPAPATEEARTTTGTSTLIGRIEVTLKTRGPGEVNGAVNIHLRDGGRPPTSVPVVGRVLPPIEISPSTLLLPRTSIAGNVFQASCLCRSNEKLPFTLIVEPRNDGLVARVIPVDGNPHTQSLVVEWDPTADGKMSVSESRVVRLKAKVGDREIPMDLPVTCQQKAGLQ
jgi:hypothetical protein